MFRIPRKLAAAAAVLVAVTGGYLGVGAGPASAAESPVSGPGSKVIFVHGLAYLTGNTHNCQTYWATMQNKMIADGWSLGNFDSVQYYDDDINCDADIRNAAGNDIPVYDGNTPIAQLGKDLAWYIYSNYTANGRYVSLVGHSMGGLIMRDAVSRTAAGVAGYPPSLLVWFNVTFGTPHRGTNSAYFCGSVQCHNMRPGSAFLNSLPNRIGTGYWGTFGSVADAAVSCESATWRGGLCYTYPEYGHGAYMNDTSDARDATYKDVTGSNWHAVRYAEAQLGLAI
jgi:triacylglycerol esterase/lipase EstA (alpha/beta hydrolase family)